MPTASGEDDAAAGAAPTPAVDDTSVPHEPPAPRADVVEPPSAAGSVVPPVEPLDPAQSVAPVQRRRSRQAQPRPSLQPPLLSGRSLEPPRPRSRLDVLRQNRVLVVVALIVVLALVVVLGGKWLADRAADDAMSARSEELAELLADARPEDFLAFGASVQQDGSLAQRVRDTDGFVNVRAGAELAFIRFQPSGWWSGFTERCLVASVRPDGADIEVPHRPCNRVEVPPT